MAARHTHNDLRSASLSEYLNDESEDLGPHYELPVPSLTRKVSPRDREIDVFDAKKYFSSDSDVLENRHTPGRKLGIPSLVSEARPGAGIPVPECGSVDTGQPVNKKKDGGMRSKGILSRFRCTRYCSEVESVQVKEESPVKKNSCRTDVCSGPGRKVDDFEFPILKMGESLEDKQRDSIDVFGSEAKARGIDSVAIELERKMSVMTWDAIPKARRIPIPPRLDLSHVEDAESCASSDLFEIESISAICRDGISKPVNGESWSGKEIQKRSGSGRFSLLGCKSQKSVNVADQQGLQEITRPK